MKSQNNTIQGSSVTSGLYSSVASQGGNERIDEMNMQIVVPHCVSLAVATLSDVKEENITALNECCGADEKHEQRPFDRNEAVKPCGNEYDSSFTRPSVFPKQFLPPPPPPPLSRRPEEKLLCGHTNLPSSSTTCVTALGMVVSGAGGNMKKKCSVDHAVPPSLSVSRTSSYHPDCSSKNTKGTVLTVSVAPISPNSRGSSVNEATTPLMMPARQRKRNVVSPICAEQSCGAGKRRATVLVGHVEVERHGGNNGFPTPGSPLQHFSSLTTSTPRSTPAAYLAIPEGNTCVDKDFSARQIDDMLNTNMLFGSLTSSKVGSCSSSMIIDQLPAALERDGEAIKTHPVPSAEQSSFPLSTPLIPQPPPQQPSSVFRLTSNRSADSALFSLRPPPIITSFTMETEVEETECEGQKTGVTAALCRHPSYSSDTTTGLLHHHPGSPPSYAFTSSDFHQSNIENCNNGNDKKKCSLGKSPVESNKSFLKSLPPQMEQQPQQQNDSLTPLNAVRRSQGSAIPLWPLGTSGGLPSQRKVEDQILPLHLHFSPIAAESNRSFASVSFSEENNTVVLEGRRNPQNMLCSSWQLNNAPSASAQPPLNVYEESRNGEEIGDSSPLMLRQTPSFGTPSRVRNSSFHSTNSNTNSVTTDLGSPTSLMAICPASCEQTPTIPGVIAVPPRKSNTSVHSAFLSPPLKDYSNCSHDQNGNSSSGNHNNCSSNGAASPRFIHRAYSCSSIQFSQGVPTYSPRLVPSGSSFMSASSVPDPPSVPQSGVRTPHKAHEECTAILPTSPSSCLLPDSGSSSTSMPQRLEDRSAETSSSCSKNLPPLSSSAPWTTTASSSSLFLAQPPVTNSPVAHHSTATLYHHCSKPRIVDGEVFIPLPRHIGTRQSPLSPSHEGQRHPNICHLYGSVGVEAGEHGSRLSGGEENATASDPSWCPKGQPTVLQDSLNLASTVEAGLSVLPSVMCTNSSASNYWSFSPNTPPSTANGESVSIAHVRRTSTVNCNSGTDSNTILKLGSFGVKSTAEDVVMCTSVTPFLPLSAASVDVSTLNIGENSRSRLNINDPTAGTTNDGNWTAPTESDPFQREEGARRKGFKKCSSTPEVFMEPKTWKEGKNTEESKMEVPQKSPLTQKVSMSSLESADEEENNQTPILQSHHTMPMMPFTPLIAKEERRGNSQSEYPVGSVMFIPSESVASADSDGSSSFAFTGNQPSRVSPVPGKGSVCGTKSSFRIMSTLDFASLEMSDGSFNSEMCSPSGQEEHTCTSGNTEYDQRMMKRQPEGPLSQEVLVGDHPIQKPPGSKETTTSQWRDQRFHLLHDAGASLSPAHTVFPVRSWDTVAASLSVTSTHTQKGDAETSTPFIIGPLAPLLEDDDSIGAVHTDEEEEDTEEERVPLNASHTLTDHVYEKACNALHGASQVSERTTSAFNEDYSTDSMTRPSDVMVNPSNPATAVYHFHEVIGLHKNSGSGVGEHQSGAQNCKSNSRADGNPFGWK